jgi:hypothetical protein
MTHPLSRYRRAGGVNLIEITLSGVEQLFNTLDPSPFYEKDLDADAEDYIVGAARELPAHEPFKLILYLPPGHPERLAGSDIAVSIHNYFDYRCQTAARDLRLLLRQGRTALAIGVTFLVACLLLRELLIATHGTIERVFAESLLIAGWVAMWRPLEIFLYDWWPLRRIGRTYAKLASMDIEVHTGAPKPLHAAAATPMRGD